MTVEPRQKPQIRRIKPADRKPLALELQARYYAGSSIRNIALDQDRSYGTVRCLLLEVDTILRPRGGRHARRRSA